MKTPHTLPAALILTTMLFLTACSSDEDKKCGGEDFMRITTFPTMTASVFTEYDLPKTFGNATYETNYYENINGYSSFELMTTVINVCPFELVQVFPTLVLTPEDNSVKDTLTMSCTTDFVEQSILPVNGVYTVDELFDTKADETTLFYVMNTAYIPYQGSRSADSLYFWNIMDSFQIGTSYQTAE